MILFFLLFSVGEMQNLPCPFFSLWFCSRIRVNSEEAFIQSTGSLAHLTLVANWPSSYLKREKRNRARRGREDREESLLIHRVQCPAWSAVLFRTHWPLTHYRYYSDYKHGLYVSIESFSVSFYFW